MKQQIELGYRLASYLRDDVEELGLVIDQRGNRAGIITVARTDARLDLGDIVERFITIYTCEDAQAWGTVTSFDTIEDATAHMNRVWEALNIDNDEVAESNELE